MMLKRGDGVAGSAGVPPAVSPKAARRERPRPSGVTAGGTPALPAPDPLAGMVWHSRGYLPHCDAEGRIQTVNYRLYDSLPLAVLEQLSRRFPGSEANRRRYAEAYLDASHGACYLRDPRIARMVENAMLFFDGERYRLLDWSVMPNHVHAILEPLEGHTLESIFHSWKSFTSHEANRMLHRSGAFWWREYFDRYIRDEAHLANAKRYLEEKNPSPFSSAARRRARSARGPARRRRSQETP